MGRKNFGEQALTYPQPVWIIAAYDENGVPNAMNAAWGGIAGQNEIMIRLSSWHKTVANIRKKGFFTVSMGDAAHVAGCDYLGMATGNEVSDKLERAGFTVTKSELIDAPIINELAVCVECKLTRYEEQDCCLFAQIVNVSVDEAALTDGKVDVSKVRPITYDPFNKEYYVIGEKVGDAWSSGTQIQQ